MVLHFGFEFLSRRVGIRVHSVRKELSTVGLFTSLVEMPPTHECTVALMRIVLSLISFLTGGFIALRSMYRHAARIITYLFT